MSIEKIIIRDADYSEISSDGFGQTWTLCGLDPFSAFLERVRAEYLGPDVMAFLIEDCHAGIFGYGDGLEEFHADIFDSIDRQCGAMVAAADIDAAVKALDALTEVEDLTVRPLPRPA